MGCPVMGGSRHGSPYMQTWRGDDGRMVMFHMWPMMLIAWLLFMFGVMVGAKRSMMMQRMGTGMGMGPMGMGGMHGGKMGMGGMGMGMGMMGGKMGKGGPWMHHHHGYGMGVCCEPHEGGEQEAEEKPEGAG